MFFIFPMLRVRAFINWIALSTLRTSNWALVDLSSMVPKSTPSPFVNIQVVAPRKLCLKTTFTLSQSAIPVFSELKV